MLNEARRQQVQRAHGTWLCSLRPAALWSSVAFRLLRAAASTDCGCWPPDRLANILRSELAFQAACSCYHQASSMSRRDDVTDTDWVCVSAVDPSSIG